MSDLTITYDKLSAPPAKCYEAPPEPTPANPTPKDDCYFLVPLIDEENPKSPRMLRFDRQGSSFALATDINSSKDRVWAASHANLSGVTEALRIAGKMLRQPKAIMDVQAFRLLLTISQYVSMGKIHLPEENIKKHPDLRVLGGTEAGLASFLLLLFSYTPEETLANLLGVLAVVQGTGGLSPEEEKARTARIKWVQDVYALRLQDQRFRKHFSDADFSVEYLSKLDPKEAEKVWLFLAFCRQAVIRHWMGGAFKYDELFVNTFKAFPEMKSRKDPDSKKIDFCKLVEEALRELGMKMPDTFHADCLAALQLVQRDPVVALQQSVKRNLLNEAGQAFLQHEVQEESRRANMKIDWLFSRGRLTEILDAFNASLKVSLPAKPGEALQLTLDFQAFSGKINGLINTNLVNLPVKREYILSAMALLRRLFDENGHPRSLHVFHDAEFKDVSFNFSKGSDADAKAFHKEIVDMFNLSEERSEKTLPAVELAVCAAGGAGLLASELLLEDGSDLQWRVGISGAAALGAGCGAFAAHKGLPKVITVRNRFLWEGFVAALTGTGAALLYNGLKESPGSGGSDVKNPVDGFGPREVPTGPRDHRFVLTLPLARF